MKGNICASCGGNVSKPIEQSTPYRVPIDPQIPDVEPVSILRGSPIMAKTIW